MLNAPLLVFAVVTLCTDASNHVVVPVFVEVDVVLVLATGFAQILQNAL
jgi:hypothetical protein